jgi:hypothetical protein
MKCFPITLSLAIALLFVADPASAGTPVQQLTADAMRECALGRQAQTRTERVQHFAQGQAFGEQAVEKDDLSPDAHFSLFCNLGEQLRIDGESLTSLFGFRRMMKELNRTLELAPDHLDALSAREPFWCAFRHSWVGIQKKGRRCCVRSLPGNRLPSMPV